MATGNWGMKVNASKQRSFTSIESFDISQHYFTSKEVQTPSDNTGKLIPPRKLHGTSWGYVCPTETPEARLLVLSRIYQ